MTEILLTAREQVGHPNHGKGLTLLVILAAVGIILWIAYWWNGGDRR